jgi:hypothetical protein
MRITALAAAALLAASPLAAFASDHQDADLAMTQAGTAIEGAERADAAQYASADLGNAHSMLASAQADYDHRHWTDAIIGAENAKADADLAAARSRELRAEQATAEVERSVRSLRDQLGISAGDQP